MQMVGKSIGNMHMRKIECASWTHHLNPNIAFNNKHYRLYTKYKHVYLNYK